jgi:hypothetical protein
MRIKFINSVCDNIIKWNKSRCRNQKKREERDAKNVAVNLFILELKRDLWYVDRVDL